MRILLERPPNFDAIVAAFPFATNDGVIFTYGEVIFNPSGVEVPGALRAHEAVHSQRQLAQDMDPATWWDRYLAERQFRLEEELIAHRAEYRAHNSWERDPRKRERMLEHIALKLAGPLYGEMINPTLARRLVRVDVDQRKVSRLLREVA